MQKVHSRFYENIFTREEVSLKINFNAHLPLFFIKTTILEIITLKVMSSVQELAQFTWLAPGAISPIVENCVAQAGFILVKQVGIRSQDTIHVSQRTHLNGKAFN